MDESVICLEDSIDVIDLSETVLPNSSPQHSRDDIVAESFVRETRRRTRRTSKKQNAVPAAIIDLSEENDLSSSSTFEQQHRNSSELCCPVCFESLSKVQVKATICGHVFCSTCIESTVKQNKSCPKCRRKLTIKNLMPLYL